MRLRVVSGPVSVVACVIAATACGGHVTGPGSTRSAGAPPATAASTPARTVALRAPWPERRILPESIYPASRVFDPGTGVLYTLVSRTQTPADGPYVLRATDLRTGAVRQGDSYPLAQLSLVSGYLWVSGWPNAGTPPALGQVDPETLRTVRSVAPSRVSWGSAVAPGPAGTPEGVYHWPMFSSSVYGGGALWVTTQTGLVACVNPATGRVRASETVTSQAAQLGGLPVADGATGQVYGFVLDDGYNALVSISPPRSCWG